MWNPPISRRPAFPFSAVRAEAFLRCRELCTRLVPRGVFRGDWYFAKVPWRADDTASLGISLTSGRWRDWGREGDDGTFIDLLARLDGCSIGDAKDRLAALMGMSGDPQSWKPVKRARPRCDACRRCWHRYDDTLALRPTHHDGPPDAVEAYDKRYCTAVTDMAEEPIPTRVARMRRGRCGPDGKMFAARETA